MCEFCTKHGEGKKWYLNVRNYSHDLLSDIKRREFNRDFFGWVNQEYNKYFNFLKHLPSNMPIIGPAIRAVVKRVFINDHWGQIIPIEDVEKVLEITNSVTRVPCVCRKVTQGKQIRTCFLVSLDPQKIGIADIIDQSFFGGPDLAQFEKVDKTEALNFMKAQEKKGQCHSIWTLKAPFTGAICTCDDTGCIGMKMIKTNLPITFKSEYIIRVDVDKCNGCKACINICPFGALYFDQVNQKTNIILKRCQGCGICRAVCGQKALSLADRSLSPEVAHIW